mgnify:CR=1 FL=1
MADEETVAAPIQQAAPAIETVVTETPTPVDDGPQLILEPGEEADAAAEAAEAVPKSASTLAESVYRP